MSEFNNIIGYLWIYNWKNKYYIIIIKDIIEIDIWQLNNEN